MHDDISIPQPDEFIALARSLVPELKSRAAECEALRRLPEANVELLRDAGLVRVCMPKEFGGYELGWDVFCQAVMELAQGCASTAWVYSVYGEHAHRLGRYPKEVQAEVWGDGPDVFLSSGNSPDAELEPVEGGYRLTGHFNFSSGCDFATWHIGGSIKGRKQIAYPASDRIIIDNWHVAGLAGTGSNDTEVRDAFVPQHRTFPVGDDGSRKHESALFRLPQWSVMPFDLASVGVGIALGVVADFTTEMKERSSRFGAKIAEFQSLQLRIAESAAEAEAAKRMIIGDLRESMDYLTDHDEMTVEMMNRNKRDMAYSAVLAVRAVDRLFYAAGANGLFLSNDMQRAFRDVHAAGAQLALNWDANGTDYGRVMLGMKPLSPRR